MADLIGKLTVAAGTMVKALSLIPTVPSVAIQ
jgi:hypothetical protein